MSLYPMYSGFLGFEGELNQSSSKPVKRKSNIRSKMRILIKGEEKFKTFLCLSVNKISINSIEVFGRFAKDERDRIIPIAGIILDKKLDKNTYLVHCRTDKLKMSFLKSRIIV